MEILVHTPKWVFGLLGLLLFLGWQQSRDRTVKNYLIYMLPVGMLFLSYFGVSSSFGVLLAPIGLWILGLVLSAFIFSYMFVVSGVTYDTENSRYTVPGSWIPLGLMMAIFFTKYIVGVLSAVNPVLLEEPAVIYFCCLLYGVFSGVFVGRAVSMWASCRFAKTT